jgi:hypothetical protein
MFMAREPALALTSERPDAMVATAYREGHALAFLDTLIVLVAVYFALATACSFLQEQIASITRWRGETLFRGVLNLLSGAAPVVAAIYQHPLVTSASYDKTGTSGGAQRTRPNDSNYRPSYLDARTFTLAFHDILANTDVVAATNAGTLVPGAAPAYNAITTIVKTPDELLGALQRIVTATDANGNATSFASSPLARQLSTLLLQAENDYDKLLAATDAWFNRQMDRVSGWYKRWAQTILIVLGVVIVGVLNIDSIRIVGALQAQPALSGAVADKIVAAYESAAPVATPSPGTTPSPGSAATDQASAVLHAFDGISTEQLAEVVMPGPASGWSFAGPGAFQRQALHILGLLITAAAAALGAPFWFELLSRLVNVRLAGAKPKRNGGSSS